MAAKNNRPKQNEVRSYFTAADEPLGLPSDTDPCSAPDGHYWVRAYSPNMDQSDDLLIGKWLVRMTCPYVAEYWGMIRHDVEAGNLGIAAKIATEWGRINDPAGPWRNHVVCVYTADWRDEADVHRVAKRLRDIGAVKKMLLTYKPDIFTYGGIYEGNSPGDVAIYTCKAPYDQLDVDPRNLAAAESLLTLK